MSLQPPVVLLVDDEQPVLDVLRRFCERAGFQVITCRGGNDALEHLRGRRVDVALVDLLMPDVGGLDVLRAIRETDPSCRVVLVTGHATIDTAVEAVKLGAADYLSKPVDFERLDQILRGVREDIERRGSLLEIEADVARRLEFCGMVGRGPAMQELFNLVRRLAPHLRTALVTGETGTGKELVARALHAVGPRSAKPFVVVSCFAVHESAFEAELFGQAATSQPGGTDGRPGLLELADGGTVFLDEVSELPLAAQARLVRVLEFGELHRVGSLESRHVDLQVIAASHRDLRGEIAAGHFRSDLYYRLNVVEVSLPPLRERREDIPTLSAAFIRECAARLSKAIRGITAAAEGMLTTAPWDGNVRELRNVIERACLMADGGFLTEREVSVSMPPLTARTGTGAGGKAPVLSPEDEDQLLSTVEREHILRALQRARGNKKAAARMLGVSRRALYRRLERLDLGGTIARRRGPSRPPGASEETGAA